MKDDLRKSLVANNMTEKSRIDSQFSAMFSILQDKNQGLLFNFGLIRSNFELNKFIQGII